MDLRRSIKICILKVPARSIGSGRSSRSQLRNTAPRPNYTDHTDYVSMAYEYVVES